MQREERVVIGLAGNIGSGKSTAADYFVRRGSHRINADAIGRRLLPTITKAVINRLGSGVASRHRLDRDKLRTVIFSDPRKLRIFNRLSHPRLVREIRDRLRQIRSGIVVVDAALLFDWPVLMPEIDVPILVTAPRSLKERRAARKGIDRRTFRRILQSQRSENVMARQAAYVIRNNGSTDHLYRQCRTIYKEIKNDC